MLNFIKDTIYQLKKEYGQSITIYKIATSIVDYDTGVKNTTVSFKRVKKAVLLPSSLIRTFVYKSGLDPDFKEGAFIDVNDRIILIDARDIRNFEIEIDDYIIYDDKRWLVIKSTQFEDQAAYLIQLRVSEGSELFDPANNIFIDTITFIQETKGIKS